MSNPRLLSVMFFLILICFVGCGQNKKPFTDNSKHIIYDFEEEQDTINEIALLPEKSGVEKLLEEMGIIKIQDSIPEILVDLKYAGNDNFLGFNFYGNLTNAYIQQECLKKLQKAYSILQAELPGYTFIIYDAVRSIESQQLMWDSLNVPEKQKFWYVADPRKGSLHNYGQALDLTVADQNGIALDMGTEFDYFGELAFPDRTDYFYASGKLNEIQYKNRNLLMSIMKEAGFTVSKTEWWHYNASSLSYAKEKYKAFSTDTNNFEI